MRLLLDTHIALWAVADDPKLSSKARDFISDASNDKIVSVASIWEIAIKHALTRRRANGMPISGGVAARFFEAAGYEFLHISPDHAEAVDGLPQLHGDPFDRMLVAQALFEPLRLLTHDPGVAAYSETFILA